MKDIVIKILKWIFKPGPLGRLIYNAAARRRGWKEL